MPRVSFGTQTFASKRDAKAFVRNFLDTSPVDTEVPASIVTAWLGPLIRMHPSAKDKLANWDGRVVIQHYMRYNCAFIMLRGGKFDNVATNKCMLAL